ncbi:hypothetical protein Godav_006603 [Gossypium davidsonii]|uniref:RNase H type-1 domain-containing protein n=1 Tax=Gossypium davidsonii TaxID=34287 RepID=A0A7J8S4A1_GOSDV|nr:hypothetical protein [Gossypium davidsonii]
MRKIQDRVLTTKEKLNRDRGARKEKGKEDSRFDKSIANLLLPYSDINNRRKVILKEAKKPCEVGKKFSFSVQGDEEIESSWRICSNRCGIDTIKSRSSSSIWCPPSEGCLKINVCGIANDDSAGCGGILRDMEGVARALFSGLIATNDADSAEVGALLLALEVFISLEWKINDSLFIEIGSNVIFNWCANKLMRPWSLQSTFADIERKIEKVGSVVFSMEDKKGNEMASTLAIVGINRGDMFKA